MCPKRHHNVSKTVKIMQYGEGIPVRHHVKSQMPSRSTNVVTAAGLHNILMFAPTVLRCPEVLRHACRTVCIYFLQIFTTVVPYCSTLHLHGPFTASVIVIYIFEHLHTGTVMFHNKYASLRLHDSNATSPSTSQEYSVMHSVCFFLRAFALINI